MKECGNSTRKIHISNNFILPISLLILFDTLLPRPSLHCNTPLHFTQLHFTTLHHTSPNYTSLHLSTLHFLSFTLHSPLIDQNIHTCERMLTCPSDETLCLFDVNTVIIQPSCCAVLNPIMAAGVRK
jgi:hypothetical protein